jgi:methyl-accepting chemotaxis protein
MDEVISSADGYKRAFDDYVKFTEQQKVADDKMVKAAREVDAIADNIRQEQKAQHKELMKAGAAATQIEDKLIKADDANRIIKWILESRRQEKNFIIRRGSTRPGTSSRPIRSLQRLRHIRRPLTTI